MKKDLTGLAFGAVMMLCVFSGFVHAANSPLELITPQSGTLYRVGDKVNISFTSKGLRNRLVNLDVSHDNGVTFVPIGILDGTVRPAPKFYSFLWTVTGPPTATAIVRATIAGQPRYAPKLSGVFTIAAAATTGGEVVISTDMIVDGSITTPKIADGAITTPKIADGSVTAPKINSGQASNGFILAANGIGGVDWVAAPTGGTYTPGSPIDGAPIGQTTAAPGKFSILIATGNFTAGGTSTFTGPSTFNSTLSVGGATTLNGSLSVTGTSTFGGSTIFNGPSTFNNSLTAGGTFAVTGATTLGGTLSVAGGTTFTGTVALPTAPNSITGGGSGSGLNADKIDGLDSTQLVQTSGSTMTGSLILKGLPLLPNEAATKLYVDTTVAAAVAAATVTSVVNTTTSIVNTSILQADGVKDIAGATETFTLAAPANVVFTLNANASAALLGTGLGTIRLNLDNGAQTADQGVTLVLTNSTPTSVSMIASLAAGTHTIKGQASSTLGLIPITISNAQLTKLVMPK